MDFFDVVPGWFVAIFIVFLLWLWYIAFKFAEESYLRRRTNRHLATKIEPTLIEPSMHDFCHACGASIPHRYGEGRCEECMHHLPEDEA